MKLFDHVSSGHCPCEWSTWLFRMRDDKSLNNARAMHPAIRAARTRIGSRQGPGFVAPKWE
eukprot:11831970-Karenia_brevis.AAC.1